MEPPSSEYPLTAEKIVVWKQMPSVRVEADVREQVSLAKSIADGDAETTV